jgi:hypothetical protein
LGSCASVTEVECKIDVGRSRENFESYDPSMLRRRQKRPLDFFGPRPNNDKNDRSIDSYFMLLEYLVLNHLDDATRPRASCSCGERSAG